MYVYGSHFGVEDYGAVVSIGETMCSATMYTTNTFLQCTVAAGVGGGLSLRVSVGGQVGSKEGAMSYDSPRVTGVSSAVYRLRVSTG